MTKCPIDGCEEDLRSSKRFCHGHACFARDCQNERFGRQLENGKMITRMYCLPCAKAKRDGVCTMVGSSEDPVGCTTVEEEGKMDLVGHAETIKRLVVDWRDDSKLRRDLRRMEENHSRVLLCPSHLEMCGYIDHTEMLKRCKEAEEADSA